MSNFKRGDKVRVLPGKGVSSFLTEGKIYEVDDFTHGMVRLTEDDLRTAAEYQTYFAAGGPASGRYFTYRFELVEEPEQPNHDAEQELALIINDLYDRFLQNQKSGSPALAQLMKDILLTHGYNVETETVTTTRLVPL